MPPLNRGADWQRYGTGLQAEFTFDSVPATSARKVGQLIRGATLDVIGTYTGKIAVGSVQDAEVHIRAASLNGGTVTTDVYTTYYDGSTKKTSFTGVGALAAATRQTSTSPAGGMKGVQYVVVSLVVTVAAGAVIDQCEINGD